MKEIIIYIIFAFFSQYLVYKWIKKIDKRERKKLQGWEQEYIEKIIDIRRKNDIANRIEEIKEIEVLTNNEDDFLA